MLTLGPTLALTATREPAFDQGFYDLLLAVLATAAGLLL